MGRAYGAIRMTRPGRTPFGGQEPRPSHAAGRDRRSGCGVGKRPARAGGTPVAALTRHPAGSDRWLLVLPEEEPVSRLHADIVEVQRGADAPAQFLWRGRLYVVRAVLSRWTESGGWWRTAAVRAVSEGGQAASVPGARPGEVPGPAGGVDPAGGLDDGEQDWFRVEAGAGSSVGTGVYDLCFCWATGSWSLARVLD